MHMHVSSSADNFSETITFHYQSNAWKDYHTRHQRDEQTEVRTANEGLILVSWASPQQLTPQPWLVATLSLCPGEDYCQNNMDSVENRVLQQRADLAFTPGFCKVTANPLEFPKEEGTSLFHDGRWTTAANRPYSSYMLPQKKWKKSKLWTLRLEQASLLTALCVLLTEMPRA